MARTHKVIRTYVNRIIELRRIILPAETSEVNTLGDKLGTGTFRSRTFPGYKVYVGDPVGGLRTSWKDVAWTLARAHNIPVSEVMAIANAHTTETPDPAHLSVKVLTDKARTPKGLVV